jgi:NADH-quinone oxidoreductase subunit K
MIPVTNYLILGAILFGLSLVGIMINRKNIILLLVCMELMLLAVNTNFVAFSHYYQEVSGQIFVFFVLTVAAAEAAIGLAIVILLYRNRGNIDVDKMNHLKG